MGLVFVFQDFCLIPLGTPTASVSGISWAAPMVCASSQTIAKSGSFYLQPPGIPGQQAYYKNGNASYLYTAQVTIAGSGTASFGFYNQTSSANAGFTQGQYTLSSTPTTYSYGPYPFSYCPFAASSQFGFFVYNPTSGNITLSSCYLQFQVCQ